MKKIVLTLLALSIGGAGLLIIPQAMYSGGKCTKCKCAVFVSKNLSSKCICGHDVSAHENGRSNAPTL